MYVSLQPPHTPVICSRFPSKCCVGTGFGELLGGQSWQGFSWPLSWLVARTCRVWRCWLLVVRLLTGRSPGALEASAGSLVGRVRVQKTLVLFPSTMQANKVLGLVPDYLQTESDPMKFSHRPGSVAHIWSLRKGGLLWGRRVGYEVSKGQSLCRSTSGQGQCPTGLVVRV